nr:MAG TPA: hypothetical protein [Caudoviricetes sp.]
MTSIGPYNWVKRGVEDAAPYKGRCGGMRASRPTAERHAGKTAEGRTS